MKGIIARCYMFSRRGWISIFLCASDWTPNPTSLNHVGNLWASVTTKSRIKLVSCAAVFKAQQISRIGPSSSLCTAFCYVGFLYKLHLVRPKKSRFTTSQPQIKRKRKLAILKAWRKFFQIESPLAPEHCGVGHCPFQSELLITKRSVLAKRKLKAVQKTKSG